MAKWVKRKIGSLGRVVTGKTPSTNEKDNFGGPYPFITVPDLDGRVFIDSTARTLSEKGTQVVRSCRLPKNAVVLSCRATIGKCGITTQTSFTNQTIHSVIPNDDVSARFLYYAFRQLGDVLRSVGGGGSVFLAVSKSRFSDIEIFLPYERKDQEAIADVLGSLDDKIEINRRMNDTLEAMGRVIFKDWFIDFGPVRARAEGGASYLASDIWDVFPDAFGSDGRPVGWRLSPVSKFAKIKGGSQLSKNKFLEDGHIPVFGGAGLMGQTNSNNACGFVISVGRVGAYCGQFFSHRGKAWINNNASQIMPFDNVSGEWLLLALRNLNMNLIKKGAAQPFVSNADIGAMKVVDPGLAVMTAFHDCILNLMLRQEANRRENITLAQIRDILMPKLMAGEICIADAMRTI